MEEDFDEAAMDACLVTASGQRAEHYESERPTARSSRGRRRGPQPTPPTCCQQNPRRREGGRRELPRSWPKAALATRRRPADAHPPEAKAAAAGRGNGARASGGAAKKARPALTPATAWWTVGLALSAWSAKLAVRGVEASALYFAWRSRWERARFPAGRISPAPDPTTPPSRHRSVASRPTTPWSSAVYRVSSCPGTGPPSRMLGYPAEEAIGPDENSPDDRPGRPAGPRMPSSRRSAPAAR